MEARRVVQATVGIGVRIEQMAVRQDEARGQIRGERRTRAGVKRSSHHEAAGDCPRPGSLRISPGPLQDQDGLARAVGYRGDADGAVAVERTVTRTVVVEPEGDVRKVAAGGGGVGAGRDRRDGVSQSVGDGERARRRELIRRAKKRR